MTDNTLCCPKFDVSRYDKKTFAWENKKFIKDSMRTFFHIPFPNSITKTITKLWAKIEEHDAWKGNDEDYLILFRDPTAFKSEIYLLSDKIIPECDNVEISGNFYSRVYDGGYMEINKFIKELKKELDEKGLTFVDLYCFYPYCPKCVKAYGHNYQVLLAKLK